MHVAYDEDVAERVRFALAGRDGVHEQKMFGGIAFMVQGHMCVGVLGAELLARLGPEESERALAEPHTRVMDFTGRPMSGFVVVAPEGVATDEALESWVDRALAFVSGLPPK